MQEKPLKELDAKESAEIMQGLARGISQILPNMGFALFVFEFNKPGRSNYVSNSGREQMIKMLEETVQKFKAKEIDETVAFVEETT